MSEKHTGGFSIFVRSILVEISVCCAYTLGSGPATASHTITSPHDVGIKI